MEFEISPRQVSYAKLIALFGRDVYLEIQDEESKPSDSTGLSGSRKKGEVFLFTKG